MAEVTFSSIAGALAEIFDDRIAWQINRSVVLAQLLPVSGGTGKNIQWDARFGDANPGTAVIADGADVTVFNSDRKVPAVLQFGTYHDAFGITGKARAGAFNAANPAELADLYANEIGESTTRLAKGIAVDLYTGTGATDNINGLLSASGAAPGIGALGTYAGIDRAVEPQWAASILSNGGVPRSITFALMRTARRVIYTASGEKPDLIVCDPTTHENYGKLFGQERRYIDEIRMRGNTIRLDGGYQVLEFDGVPVIEDVNHPAGKMTFMNTMYVHLKQQRDVADAVNRSPGFVDLHGTPEEQFGPATTQLKARINPLAITGDAYRFQLLLYPQIQVQRANSCAVIEDLLT